MYEHAASLHHDAKVAMNHMNQEIVQAIKNEVKTAVKETVNGKIDRLDKKLDDHIAKVEPFLQGAAGFSLLWKFCVAVGSTLVIWVQIKSLFHY